MTKEDKEHARQLKCFLENVNKLIQERTEDLCDLQANALDLTSEINTLTGGKPSYTNVRYIADYKRKKAA